MKPIILAAALFILIANFAHAGPDCGLSASLRERIASCGKTFETLELVMEKNGVRYWYQDVTKSAFQVVYQALASELQLDEVKSNWDLADKGELTMSVAKVFGIIAKDDFNEKRFWLYNTYQHASGKVWSYYYSTRGTIGHWFADAADAWYVGGICSVILK